MISSFKKSFTLIELLIVMAVTSILIAIIIPSLKGMREQALIDKAKGELRTIQIAIESYYKNQKSYPATVFSQPDLQGGFPTNLGYLMIPPCLVKTDPKILIKLPDDPFKTSVYLDLDNPGEDLGGGLIRLNRRYTYMYTYASDGYYILASSGLNKKLEFSFDPDTGTVVNSGDDIIVTNARLIKQ